MPDATSIGIRGGITRAARSSMMAATSLTLPASSSETRRIRARKLPNADIEQAHHSACLVHSANLSYRVGNKQLWFDASAERFTNSDEANALLKPKYRKQYRIPDEV